ncbi:GAF domain protein (macronuclear) [Tetrahymena thermophila SB210]|uniref:GAF domain protein n=1 Tax=Tetrahymena thermophila (strain SB210) TaxID=312017 RepID=I7MB25_TETTS|nr:GAF domain protein [Tetrahymena thermophila SB210]EAS07182.2 GAF domain protein [Tetrahymena thermophila SB210]|eukprot:XP_001027424.2 GAF domain protein [Tetrahymena thermophila SB210]
MIDKRRISKSSSQKQLQTTQQNMNKQYKKFNDLICSYKSPILNCFSPQENKNQKRKEGDDFRQTKLNSLLPNVNHINTTTSSQIYNSIDNRFDEEDKYNNSQIQNYYDEGFCNSKSGFNTQNTNSNNHTSFSKSAAETIKLQEKQIKHLKMMNEYYEISLKQKDQIYKMLVLENIKLKHQIQQLEQQNNNKGISTSESHLLFKKQKVLLNDHSQKSPKQSLIQQMPSQSKEIENTNTSQASQGLITLDKQSSEVAVEFPEKVELYQRRSSKQKLTFIFKPPRVSNEQYSQVPYKMKNGLIQKNSNSTEQTSNFVNGNKEKSFNVSNFGNSNNSNNNQEDKSDKQQKEKTPPKIQNSNLKNHSLQKTINFNDKAIIVKSPIQSSSKKKNSNKFFPSEEQNQNYLGVKNKSNKVITNLSESFRRISDYPLQDDNDNQSQQFNQSFLNETPHGVNSNKTTFDQFDDAVNVTTSNFQPKKSEMKANFVSHSTDFAFITQLLELKSKPQDNLKIYNENKSIQYIRQMLNDEKNLKKTILNLSKNTFGQFYDCLLYTLESSDLFFHLTNKLKNLINAIIKIHLSVEINEAFSIIVKECCNVLECDRASVFLVNPQTSELWTKIAKDSGVIKVPFGQGLVGFVANTMKPLNILDAHKDSRFNPEIDKKNNYLTKSVLCVPVIDSDKGNLVGVMQAINKNDGFFTKDDEGCLQIMAYHAMNVLRTSISIDQKQKNQSMIKNLLHLSIKLGNCITLETLVSKSRNMIQSYLDVGEFKIFLVDKEKSKLFTINYQNEREEFELSCGLIGHCLSLKQDLTIDNAYNHTNFNQLVDINTSMPLCMYIIWDNPKKKNQILGVIQVINQGGIHNIGSPIKNTVKFDTHLKLFCEIIGSQLKKFLKPESTHYHSQLSLQQNKIETFQQIQEQREIQQQMIV